MASDKCYRQGLQIYQESQLKYPQNYAILEKARMEQMASKFTTKNKSPYIKKLTLNKHIRNWKELTLAANFGELAVNNECVLIVLSSGQSLSREKLNQRPPSDRAGYKIEPSADEVTVELDSWWIQSKRAGYGPQVESLLVPCHKLN